MSRRRAMGQHFLVDEAIAARIVSSFAPRPGQHILEIGPGRGILTRRLLQAGARVTAIEKDDALAADLPGRLAGLEGLTLIHADVLACDLVRLASDSTARVLANLPYSITGPVLMQLFAAAGSLTDMTLMLQKEVVDRILAAPGTRVYGSLSIVAQYFTEPVSVMTLAPGAFRPAPAVWSAVVRLPFRPGREMPPEQERAYPAFVRTLFARRRQTLRNNLKAAGYSPPDEPLARAGVEASRRPETLSRSEGIGLYAACRAARRGA